MVTVEESLKGTSVLLMNQSTSISDVNAAFLAIYGSHAIVSSSEKQTLEFTKLTNFDFIVIELEAITGSPAEFLWQVRDNCKNSHIQVCTSTGVSIDKLGFNPDAFMHGHPTVNELVEQLTQLKNLQLVG